MIFATVAAISALAIALGIWASPRRVPVRAARAKPAKWWQSIMFRGPLATVVVDENGKVVNLKDRFVGVADGDSFSRFGIPSGATFYGHSFEAARLSAVTGGASGNAVAEQVLAVGDIVVIDPEAAASPNVPWRLRKISEIKDNLIHFETDANGDVHNPRPFSAVCAKVTHVLT